MSFSQTLKKVNESEVFKNFIKENPDAELCAGFFIIDFFSNDNKNSIDYKLGEKIFTFNLRENGEVKMNEDRLIELKGNQKFPKLEKLNPSIKVDVPEVRSIAQIKALDEGIHSKFNKIIAVLQNQEGNQVWNLTCILDGLIILHLLIDANSGDVTKFERKSMMDLIRKK